MNKDHNLQKTINEVSDLIIERSESLGLTKIDLAAKLGKNPSQITRIYGKRCNFNLRNLLRIAEKLNCHLKIELIPK